MISNPAHPNSVVQTLTDEQQRHRTKKAASRLRQFALDVQDTLASYVTARDGCPPAWKDEEAVSPMDLMQRLNYVLRLKHNNNTPGEQAQPAQQLQPLHPVIDDRVLRKNERLRGLCKKLRETHRECHDQLNEKQFSLAQIQQQLANALSEVEQARQEAVSLSQCEQPSGMVVVGASGQEDGAGMAALQMWQARTQRLEEYKLHLQRIHADERDQLGQACDRITLQMTSAHEELEKGKKEQERLNSSLDEANQHISQLQSVNMQHADALAANLRAHVNRPAPAASPVSTALACPSVSFVESKETTKSHSQTPPSAKSSDWSAAPNGLNLRPAAKNERRVVPLSKRFNKDSKAIVQAKPSGTVSNQNAAGECYGTCERGDLSKTICVMVDEIYELMEKDAVLFGDADKVKDFEFMLWQFQKKVRDLLRTNDADSPSCVTTPEDYDDESTIKENK